MNLPGAGNRLHFPLSQKCGLRFVHSNRKFGLMQRLSLLSCLLGGLLIAPAWAQSTPAATPPAAATTGGLVHGTVKAGNIPLPGASVVATNTLTGQRYSTVTDINGN
jgi:hypothetical protein